MTRKAWALIALWIGTAAAAEPVTQITDGSEWRAKVSGGPNVRMRLNPDGTGRVRAGPIGRKVTWQRSDTGLCINNLPRSDGPQCFVLQTAETGFVMFGDDGGTITLRR